MTKKFTLKNVLEYKSIYLMILPALLLVFLFRYVPMFGIVLAFKDYDIMTGFWGSPWVGLDNFKEIFTSPGFAGSIKNTIVYSLVLVFGTFPFPIILALMFNEIRNAKYKKIVQTVSYMPHFLSWISVIAMFFTFVSFEGPLNELKALFYGAGYEPTNILFEEKNFLPVLFTSSIYKNVGWSSVIYLAAIAGIDPSLYEAAVMDGCGKFKQVLHITLPSIAGTILIVFVMQAGNLMNVSFEQIYGFQNVYVEEATEVIGTIVYKQGIGNGEYSLATALGLFQGTVSVILILVSNALSKKLAGASIW